MSEISNHLSLIQLLLQGQKSTKQLQILIGQREDGAAAAVDLLLDKILTSFSESIDRIEDQIPKEKKFRKRSKTETDKRGCYKRRSVESRTEVSATLEDGQTWRKYGQKTILQSKFPRSYFRCSHKYDQGCNATKKVQKMEKNPQLYQTTYIGFHTCRTNPNLKDNVVGSHLLDFSTSSSSAFPPPPSILDLEISSQMYSCFSSLDDVTSQFDTDFEIDQFFLGGEEDR